MKTICITGTPGTGKTTLALKLANKLKYEYIDVNKVISKHKLSSGYDKKRKCKIIDTKKLDQVLVKIINNSKDNLIIDSHLSHYLQCKYVDLCVVTKASLKVISNRLKKRKYSKQKIKDNLEAEAFDSCFIEAQEIGHRIVVIDTTKGIKISKILPIIFKKLSKAQ